MERKIAVKLNPRISEFIRKKSGLDYSLDTGYFHYPNYRNYQGFLKDAHLGDWVFKNYQEVNGLDFINYFNENETMKTKFIDVSGTSKLEKKETVFTHGQLKSGEFNDENTLQPKDFKEVYFLGEFYLLGSLFKAVDKDGDSFLYKGIKGDEFNF